MSLFDDALRTTLRFEGGYVNNPADRGGPTNQGITQRTYDSYRGIGNERDVRQIDGEEVADIYLKRYWLAARCDQWEPLSRRLAFVVFDCAVHSGPERAIKLLQRVCGLTPDGIAGPVTLSKVAAQIAGAGEEIVVLGYLAERQAFLERLVERDPTQAQFAKGWTKRLRQLGTAAQQVTDA